MKNAVYIMSEYNEEIGSDQGIGMDQILREAEQNSASWKKERYAGDGNAPADDPAGGLGQQRAETLDRLQDVLLREGGKFHRHRAETPCGGTHRATVSPPCPARQTSPAAETVHNEIPAPFVAPAQRR